MAQQFWQKLNANERMVVTGAGVVLVGWLAGAIFGGGIGASWSFLAAIAVLVIYWLKYSPNQSINWPAPIPTIVLVIAGIAALLSLIGLLAVFSFLGGFFLGFFAGYLIAIVVNAIGAVMMALGAWREYQAMPKTSPPPAAPPPSNPSA
jgi:hypothetical protein